MKRISVLVLLLFLLTATAFAANNTFVMPKVGIEKGDAIPDFTLINLAGKKSSIKDYRGKIVFLNFWATWCPPCRQEMPSMEKLWNKYKEKDFIILAVSVDSKSTKSVSDFISSNNYTFPVFHDTDGVLSELFLIRSIPTTFILDKNGVITDKVTGASDWSTLNVDMLIKGKKGN